ncbi:hypothetical protein SAMN05443999_102236 [Roseovarius azorensis]|uniref:Hpt domain-containing protein n=1 Tax=Roseovarius azorensis TaxID=1287727 RepID=A0A1H7JSW2_9RHOB|nr:hypothetical protein SAMN05443999_102236 [Roseovarius azorensis]
MGADDAWAAGENVEQVTLLKQNEYVRLDASQLTALYHQLGEADAEDIVCRALEELAARLSHAERCYREGRLADMRKSSRSLIAIADQIGMRLLAQVAGDVTGCIDSGDHGALAATFARLLRIGERSLCEIWDLQDLPF